jgi:hypothetical protein
MESIHHNRAWSATVARAGIILPSNASSGRVNIGAPLKENIISEGVEHGAR